MCSFLVQISDVIYDDVGIIRNDAVPLSIILVNSIANTLELIIILLALLILTAPIEVFAELFLKTESEIQT